MGLNEIRSLNRGKFGKTDICDHSFKSCDHKRRGRSGIFVESPVRMPKIRSEPVPRQTAFRSNFLYISNGADLPRPLHGNPPAIAQEKGPQRMRAFDVEEKGEDADAIFDGYRFVVRVRCLASVSFENQKSPIYF